MPRYALARHMRWCPIDGGGVFLDLRSNAYFALEGEDVRAMERALESVEAPLPDSSNGIVAALRERGVLTGYGDDWNSPVIPEPASMVYERGWLSDRWKRPSVRTAIRFCQAVALAKWHLRFLSLAEVVRRLEDNLAHVQAPSAIDLELLCQQFRRLRMWVYTSSGVCLFDSLAFTYFLRMHQVRARLLIGVRTRPFSAHAWVQLGDRALSDKLERVQQFTPLLVA